MLYHASHLTRRVATLSPVPAPLVLVLMLMAPVLPSAASSPYWENGKHYQYYKKGGQPRTEKPTQFVRPTAGPEHHFTAKAQNGFIASSVSMNFACRGDVRRLCLGGGVAHAGGKARGGDGTNKGPAIDPGSKLLVSPYKLDFVKCLRTHLDKVEDMYCREWLDAELACRNDMKKLRCSSTHEFSECLKRTPLELLSGECRGTDVVRGLQAWKDMKERERGTR